MQDNQMQMLERIATAIEKLADDPVIEMEVAPPVCPYCGVFNPLVTTKDSAGTGKLVEFHVHMTCMECKKSFFGSPVQWSMHTEVSTLRKELHERAEYVGRSAQRNHS